jgi:hypothetical protein
VLFKRWRKAFTDNGDAMVILIPIKNIIRSVGVVDENPEMIEEKHGVRLFLNSKEEQQLLLDDHEICHDVVWEVLDIKMWAGEFLTCSDFVKHQMTTQADTTARENSAADHVV